jgi:hypothetical protein
MAGGWGLGARPGERAAAPVESGPGGDADCDTGRPLATFSRELQQLQLVRHYASRLPGV